MEEKKFFMPPPPRELQRNIPKPPQAVEKVEEKTEEPSSVQERQEIEPVSFDDFNFSTPDSFSVNSTPTQKIEAEDVEVDKGKYKLKLLLCYIGLVVSVALFGVCLFFLIK